MNLQDEIEELRRLLAELRERVQRLEQAVPLTEARPDPSPPIPGRAGAPAAGPNAAHRESMESRIGSRWFNRVGIVAVLMGVAYFLKYVFENNWIGPVGRSASGLAAGVAVVMWSEALRRRGHVVFSWSLKAIGIGTLYLSLWAGFQVYHLFPASVAFAAMVLVTGGTVLAALNQNAQVVALFGLIGGFATPLLLSTGQNHEVALFTYVGLLDLAILAIAIARLWMALLAAGLAGTEILYFAWYLEFYSPAQLHVTLAFASLFLLIFAVAPVVGARQQPATRLDQVSPVLVLAPLLNAGIYFLQAYLLLERRHHDALTWTAVVLAAGYLALGRAVRGQTAKHQTSRLLKLVNVGLAIAFLTTAIALKLEAHWITVGWLAEAAALMWVGFRRRSAFLRWQALAVLAITIAKVFTYDISGLERGFRIISFIALGVLLLAVSFAYQRDWLRLAMRADGDAKGKSAPASHTSGTALP